MTRIPRCSVDDRTPSEKVEFKYHVHVTRKKYSHELENTSF